jgi:hypothetical protein
MVARRCLLFSLLLMALLSALPASADEAWAVGASWLFEHPWSVSVYPADGSCWVAGLGGVMRVAPGGSIIWQSEAEQFTFAWAVSVDTSDGSCWVSDTGASEIVHLALDGTELLREAGYSVACIAADPSDHSCWVLANGQQLARLDADGTVTQTIPGVVGAAYPSAALVLDPSDSSIWASVGYLLTHWASDGSPLGAIGLGEHIRSLAVDPQDHTCWGCTEVRPDNLFQFGTDCSVSRQFDINAWLISVAVDPRPGDGSVWAGCAYMSGGVVHLDPDDGAVLAQLGALSAMSVAVDPTDGTCWVADECGGWVDHWVAGHRLTVDESGGADGSVVVRGVERHLPFLGVFPVGTSLTLEAVPGAGYELLEWTGDLGTLADNPIAFDLDTPISITASFVPIICEAGVSEFPWSMTWDSTAAASVWLRNLGATDWIPSRYALASVGNIWSGPDLTDRWGLTTVPLPKTVSPGGELTVDLTLTAPPLTTVYYSGYTGEPQVTDLWNNWMLSRTGKLSPGSDAIGWTVISRFPDIQPDTPGAWARSYVEECAGRVPVIVQGYPSGTYRPALQVGRDAMAVYIFRSLKLPTQPYENTFSDIPSDHWAWQEIEALVRAGVVQGFDNGTYRPTLIVNRGTMAVYVSRALVGGPDVPTGPAVPTFSDVALDHWAYDEIEYCVAQGIVNGYENGTYRPDNPVDRGQMAAYVYRGFIQSTGTPVILGGPAVTAVDPETALYWGWSSLATGPAADPGYAYVVLDGVRLGDNLLYPHTPSGVWQVRFELRRAAAPDVPAAGAYATTLSLSGWGFDRLKWTDGSPYSAVYWDLPSGLAPGDYLLVVSAADETGALYEIPRRHPFTITP